ncbi:MAG: class I SAM-dependent rRNA methyltransferase [Pirellulales bacterium]
MKRTAADKPTGDRTIVVHLRKDLTRDIKRGHVWIYSDACDLPRAASGSTVIIEDRKGDRIACGMYDPEHPIPVRICRTSPPWSLDRAWLEERFTNARNLRRAAFDETTTGYRLINGEGDGLPGLVIDVYSQVAVIKLDGGAPQSFYQIDTLIELITRLTDCRTIVHRPRVRGQFGTCIKGTLTTEVVPFLENGMRFEADVIHGQKTGFFLDQRDNRAIVRSLSNEKRVLNLFSFSGGFSIAAGMGGAVQVCSVDLAPQAVAAADRHWQLNGLPTEKHQGTVCDCFEFLEQAVSAKRTWDIVICDPPSFAPSERARTQAEEAYQRLAHASARVTAPGGLLALASCSSHISASRFRELNLAGIGRARRTGRLIIERSLPLDHPTPLAMPELAYLKFQLLTLE